jgi:hypothetical protein
MSVYLAFFIFWIATYLVIAGCISAEVYFLRNDNSFEGAFEDIKGFFSIPRVHIAIFIFSVLRLIIYFI